MDLDNSVVITRGRALGGSGGEYGGINGDGQRLDLRW